MHELLARDACLRAPADVSLVRDTCLRVSVHALQRAGPPQRDPRRADASPPRVRPSRASQQRTNFTRYMLARRAVPPALRYAPTAIAATPTGTVPGAEGTRRARTAGQKTRRSGSAWKGVLDVPFDDARNYRCVEFCVYLVLHAMP